MTLEQPPAGADRILVGVDATLTSYKLDGYGEPADPGSTTVTITRADGTNVVTGASTSENGATHQLSYTLTRANNTKLDWLTAVWTDGAGSWTTYHEVVGGFYFSVAAARAADPALAGDDYPDATLRALRDEVEREFESDQAIGRALVPRYRRAIVHADRGDIYLDDPDLRRVRTLKTLETDGTLTDVFDSSVTIYPDEQGVVRAYGYGFPTGPMVIEYEYGLDRPPSDLVRAILERLRFLSARTSSGVPDKALTFNASGPGGGTYGLAVEGRAGFITAMPGVDLLIKRYRVRASVG